MFPPPRLPPPHQTSLDVLEAEHNIAQVERMQLRERRVVIERDGKEAWKWLEWTAMKVQFAKEVLAHAEGEHLQRKVTFDALAADLERNNAVASETDDTIRKLEGKLSAAGATVPPVAPVPSVAAASSAGAPDTAAYPNAPYNEKKEEKTMPQPPVSYRPRPTSKVRGNDDTDHLRDGYAKAYIRKPFFPVPSSKKNNTPAGSSVPILFGSMGTRDSTTATTTTTTIAGSFRSGVPAANTTGSRSARLGTISQTITSHNLTRIYSSSTSQIQHIQITATTTVVITSASSAIASKRTKRIEREIQIRFSRWVM